MTNNLCVILGDQLSSNISSLKNFKKNQDKILMMEVFNEATYANHHKKKLVLVFSAMRHFAKELQEKGVSVTYSKINKSQDNFTKELSSQCKKIQPKRIVITHPGEYRVLQEIKKWEKVLKIPVSIVESFYQMMRKKYQILIDNNGKPKGGKWNYDIKNRKSLPKNHPDVPKPLQHKPDDITKQVIAEVKKKFPKHFGDLEPFWFAVTHEQAKKSLNDFIKNRLSMFGPYEDAMAQEESFLYHSVLSMYLNIGLLEPKQIINKVLEKDGIKVESVEGFVRQILGWREYIRGIYWYTMPKYSKTNYFDAKNKLPKFYWTGNTEMNCIKNCIEQTIKESYAHHIQRLMITGNFALIAGIKPEEVCEWYLSVYADAYEWVELPNTHGMTLYADGGVLGSKPYAASGNYINKMSDYCKDCKYDVKQKEGDDACPFNYLYWNFFLKNQKKLEKNPRLWTVFSNIKKMSQEKKSQIRNNSKKFLIQISK